MTESTTPAKPGGLFSGLRAVANVFVELDNQPTSPTVVVKPLPAAEVPAIASLSTYAGQNLDQDMINTITTKAMARKSPYSAFIESTDVLKVAVPDETMRMQAAFAMISKDNQRSADDLIRSIDLHVADVDTIINAFAKDLATQTYQLVELPGEEAKRQEREKERLLEQAKLLRQQADEAEQKAVETANIITTIQNNATEASSSLQITKAKFTNSAEAVKANLKIKQNILLSLFKPEARKAS